MGGNDAMSRLTFKQWGHLFQPGKQSMGEGDKTRAKPTADVYLLCTGIHLIQIYLTRQVATEHFHTKRPEKNWAHEPLFPLGAWMTGGSQEAGQVTLSPLVTARRSSGQ